MGGAVDAAGFLNMLMRNHSVVPISDMTGILDFAGIWKSRGQVFASPAYWAFRMFSTAHATRPVAVQTDSGSYSVQHGVTRLPNIADVPYLDVVAALNDSGTTLTLFCVNRSLNTDIPTDIQVDGFTSAGAAQVKTLKSASIADINDEDDPNRVTPVHTKENIQSGKLHHIFPHESVTVITLHKNS
jgi:alpha-N-arabinofuranosidase